MSDEENLENITAEGLFQRWKGYLRTDIGEGERYNSSERIKHINTLIMWFVGLGADYEEALGYKRRVSEQLVTKKSKTYKDWKKDVEDDFEACVASYYIKTPDASNIEQKEISTFKSSGSVISSRNRMKDDEDILKWLKTKYPHVTQGMIDSAHTPGTVTWMKFMVDFFG